MMITAAVCLVFLTFSVPSLAKPSGIGKAYTLTKSEAKIKDIWSDCTKPSDEGKINSITITPNPPQKGKPVTIVASITLRENITGGEVLADVKYSFFPSITKKFMISDLAKEAGLSWPLPEGTTNIKMTEVVPSLTPSGHYTGEVTAKDQNGKEIGCVKLDFHLG